MPDVFISYSRTDKPFVQRVHKALSSDGRDVWVDWEDIPLTSDWWSEICEGIESADTFVLIVTPESLSSPMCHMEIDHAQRHNKRLIPLVRIPVNDKDAVSGVAARSLDDNARKALNNRDIMEIARENWNAVARHNWLFFQKDDEFDLNYQQLLTAIDTDLAYLHDHTRLTVRAREWEMKARNESFLLRGDDLTNAEMWLTTAVGKEPSATPLHAEYIAASRQAENQRQQQELARQERELQLQRRAAQTLRFLLGGALVSLLIAAGLLAVAISSYNTAESLRFTAVAAQETAERRADEADSIALAEQAEIVARHDPFLAYTLGLHAVSLENPPARTRAILADFAYEAGAIRPLVGHEDAIVMVAFHQDSTRALSLDWSNNFMLWNIGNDEALIQTFPVQYAVENETTAIIASVTADLRRAIIASTDGSLILVDTDPESATFGETTILQGIGNGISDVAISPNGRYALVSYYDNRLLLWDTDPTSPSFGSFIKAFDDHDAMVSIVAFNGDGNRALSVSEDNMIVWNMDDSTRDFTGSVQQFGRVADGIWQAVLSADGNYVLTTSYNGEINYWNVLLGKSDWDSPSQMGTILTLSVSADGRHALLGDDRGQISLWDTDVFSFTNGQRIMDFSGHIGFVTSVSFSPDGRHALSGGQDHGLVLWDLTTPGQRGVFASVYEMNDLVFSPDGGSAYTFSQYAMTRWDTDESSPTFAQPLASNYTQTYNELIYPSATALSTDGRFLLTADCGYVETEPLCVWRLILWDISSGLPLWNTNTSYTWISAVALSPDGRTAVVAGCVEGVLFFEDSCLVDEINVWDIVAAQPLYELGNTVGYIQKIVFSPDASRVLLLSYDNTATLWDVNTSTILHTYNQIEEAITYAVFSPDGTSVLIGANDGSLTLWDADPQSETLGEHQQTFVGHGQSVTALAFSPLGTQMMSGGSDGTLILWDVEAGEIVRHFPHSNRRVTAITFSPDGRRVLIATNVLSLWHIDTSLHELVAWLYDNRHVYPDLDCIQREQYGVEPLCDGQTLAPTRTPYPTLAPFTETPTFTPSPTVDTTLTTATPSPTPSTTVMPTATPVEIGSADFGQQTGDLPLGESQAWSFNARAGDQLTIAVNADFDTTLTIIAPDGSQLAFNDDHETADGEWTLNSEIKDLTLPLSGRYEIVVGSFANSDGGVYTLLLVPGGVTPTPTVPITPTTRAPVLPIFRSTPTPTP
jgi:WD40 repeat protein